MEDLNETLVNRIMRYVQDDDTDKAQALAVVGEYLESCFDWELTIDPSVID